MSLDAISGPSSLYHTIGMPFAKATFSETYYFFLNQRNLDYSEGKSDFKEKWQFHFDHLPEQMQKDLVREALRDLARINGHLTEDAQNEWIESNPYLQEKGRAYVRDLNHSSINTPGLRKRNWDPMSDDEVPTLIGKLALKD